MLSRRGEGGVAPCSVEVRATNGLQASSSVAPRTSVVHVVSCHTGLHDTGCCCPSAWPPSKAPSAPPTLAAACTRAEVEAASGKPHWDPPPTDAPPHNLSVADRISNAMMIAGGAGPEVAAAKGAVPSTPVAGTLQEAVAVIVAGTAGGAAVVASAVTPD